jgi:MFS family permease
MGQARLLIGVNVFWLALSLLVDGLNTLVLPYRLLNLVGEAHQATVLGLITFVGLAAGAAVQPVAGAMSDRSRTRWGRRGAMGLGVLLALPALALFGLAGGLIAAVLGYLLVQTAAGVAQAGQQALLPDLIATNRRGIAAGIKGFMDVVGATLGFVILGQLLGDGGATPALLVIGAALVLLLLLTVLLAREPARTATSTVRVGIADVFRFDVRQHRAFASLIASRFFFLLGTYAVGRFFLFFVAERLGLDPNAAAAEAGALLGGLGLVTALAALPAGWAADRIGRVPLMVAGAGLSAAGVLLLTGATSSSTILLFGGLMALGSAAFSAANWALTADLVPPAEAARFMALANFGTAGAAAAAGLFGPLVDWANGRNLGAGYTLLFVLAAVAFVISVAPLRAVVATAPVPVPLAGTSEGLS